MLTLDGTQDKTQEGTHQKSPRKNEDHKSKKQLQEHHGRGDGDVRPPQGNSNISEVNVAQLICGNTGRVQDVMMASSDDHDDEVEADLGRSMKLPG